MKRPGVGWMSWEEFKDLHPNLASLIGEDDDGCGETSGHSGLPLHSMSFRKIDDTFETFDKDADYFPPHMRWNFETNDLEDIREDR